MYGLAFGSVDQKCQRRLTKVKSWLAISIDMWVSALPCVWACIFPYVNVFETLICAPLSLLCLCICHNGPTFGQVEAFSEKDLKGEGQQLFNGERKVFTQAVIHFPFELLKLLELVLRFISINIYPN